MIVYLFYFTEYNECILDRPLKFPTDPFLIRIYKPTLDRVPFVKDFQFVDL